MVYKFTKQDNSFFYMSFSDIEDASNFSNNIEKIIEETYNFSTIPESEKLESDKAFLLFMMDRFIYLNRLESVTSAESVELLTSFSSIKQLSEVGAVPEVYGSIQALVPPIGRVYTSERQQDDLDKILAYMAIR